MAPFIFKGFFFTHPHNDREKLKRMGFLHHFRAERNLGIENIRETDRVTAHNGLEKEKNLNLFQLCLHSS